MARLIIETEGFEEILERLERAGPAFDEASRPTLLRLGGQAVEFLKEEAPVFRGKLRESVKARLHRGELFVEVGAPYASFVNFGTRPHFPPVRAITPWAQAHGIEPWALAVHISRHGTKANPFIDRAFKRLITDLRPQASDLAGRLTTKLVEG